MSEQDFFEELERRTNKRIQELPLFYGARQEEDDALELAKRNVQVLKDAELVRDATIEALREITVRPPQVYKGDHRHSPLWLHLKGMGGDNDWGLLPGFFQGDPGDNPEELYVLVARKEKK
jgi:hypothetical protein